MTHMHSWHSCKSSKYRSSFSLVLFEIHVTTLTNPCNNLNEVATLTNQNIQFNMQGQLGWIFTRQGHMSQISTRPLTDWLTGPARHGLDFSPIKNTKIMKAKVFFFWFHEIVRRLVGVAGRCPHSSFAPKTAAASSRQRDQLARKQIHKNTKAQKQTHKQIHPMTHKNII